MIHVLLVTIAVVAVSSSLSAQRPGCYVIQPGDTISQVALRSTGKASNWRAAWFQVVDPTGTRVLAKSRYDTVEPGWRACVAMVPVIAPSVDNGRWMRAVDAIARNDSNLALWIAIVVMFAAASHFTEEHLRRRRAVIQTMTRFGERFVSEFERPLIASHHRVRPIDSRLRFHPGRARLDVLLAPAHGRCYPNLSDHRTNVEYDVTRVMQALRDPAFLAGACREDGRWVVVPFRFTSISQAGGR